MSAGTLPAPPAPDISTEAIFRLSVGQYHDIIRAGILTEEDPVELLDGWLVTKMSKNPPHRAATKLTREGLNRLLPPGWYIDSQEPITTETSEPEPDVEVIRGSTLDYLDRHPGPQDVGLLVEVSEATLARDRGSKKRIYARARIPIYWIVNLIDRQIEVYTDPSGPSEKPDYRQCQIYGLADEVPVVIAGKEVGRLAVRDLLPP